MPNFKFRSECQRDVVEFLKVAYQCIEQHEQHRRIGKDLGEQLPFFIKVLRWDGADNCVEIATSIPLNKLRELMRKVPDGHVMVETLKGSDEFTGDRTSIETIRPFAELKLFKTQFADPNKPCPVCGSITSGCFIVEPLQVDCRTTNKIYTYRVELVYMPSFQNELREVMNESIAEFRKEFPNYNPISHKENES